MGTSGAYGFKKNGMYKMGYCNNDSYLSGLGQDIVDFIKSNSVERMKEIFDKIIIVKGHKIAPEYYKSKYTELEYGYGETWYYLTQWAQGELNYYNQELIHMATTPYNSAFFDEQNTEDEGNSEGNDYMDKEEWSYVINLDNDELEIYNTSYDAFEYRNLFKRIFGVSDVDADQGFLCSIPFNDIDNRFKIISDLYNEFEEKANSDDFEENEASLNTEYNIEIIQQLEDDKLKIIYGKCVRFKHYEKCDEEFISEFLNELYDGEINSNMSEKFLQDIKAEMAERFYNQ